MAGPEIEHLMQMLARLPGLGPRSARRAALYLIKRRESALEPLAAALAQVAERVRPCPQCGNFDTASPCSLCADPRRDDGVICVVEDVDDLWALERTRAFSGRYHVLGGLLSALDGIGPEDLHLPRLLERAGQPVVQEIILALPATIEGQTTAHYIADRLKAAETPDHSLRVSGLAHGVPVGGELDYLDDGTLSQALRARRPV
ncbi:recombination mediator RecR [Insolitispirillum peregrinum]|uniref:Recombination protein RecR n=1 Tax=Insolitispirillum peregrinum TaxID=80876 RepID=A0A1N7JCP1_9PROT|nr:recombination mediator RecR [Insolitispirillum peregrinum]SIS47067.1 DNA replication and repair protein RecR [Insolitispirillum peregrinum]